MTGRDRDVWQRGAEGGSEPALMLRMTKRKEQRDRNRFRRERAGGVRHPRHFALGERQEGAVRAHAFPRADDVFAGDEG